MLALFTHNINNNNYRNDQLKITQVKLCNIPSSAALGSEIITVYQRRKQSRLKAPVRLAKRSKVLSASDVLIATAGNI